LDSFNGDFWDSKGSKGIQYDFVPDSVKGFFNVEANKLKRFLISVCFLDEVSGKD